MDGGQADRLSCPTGSGPALGFMSKEGPLTVSLCVLRPLSAEGQNRDAKRAGRLCERKERRGSRERGQRTKAEVCTSRLDSTVQTHM